jgi:tripartite-type tricarboxylate transporter receptor subunit TctC
VTSKYNPILRQDHFQIKNVKIKSGGNVMLTRRDLLAGAAAVAATAGTQAGAESRYASQPVHILVGYSAGGGVDIIARLLQDPMKAALGQPVIVENRPGASAMLATAAVAKAAPDGYTLLACASGEVAINHFLFKERMAYDPAKELVPIALVGIVPCVVVVASTTPVHNPKELIAYIKANPDKLSFSSSGIGNPQQLAGELMNTMAGTKVLHVPYRGSAPAVTDVATGAVTMSFSSLAAALPLMNADKIRAVAVTSRERMPQLPDVPPLSEGAPGLAGYELLNWFAMFGTAGTPPDVVERLNGIINTALKDPGISGKLLPQGIVPKPMNIAELKGFVDSERTKFGKIVEQANIKLSN